MLVDIHQFEQVIINLAVNARDAMPRGGTLTVRTYNVSSGYSKTIAPDFMAAGEYVACEVEDTGAGIPPEILNKIWEPFFSTNVAGKGTGLLNLSTVYGIIKQTGGFIFCDSVVGQGTTFLFIYLPRHYPVVADAGAVAEAPAVAPKRADHTGKGRILLVEDEDAVRAFAARRALTSRGYIYGDRGYFGRSALERIAAGDDGFDLHPVGCGDAGDGWPDHAARIEKARHQTKVIFVLGDAEDAFEKNSEGQTDFAFLPKPFSLKQLVEKVKEVMGESHGVPARGRLHLFLFM